MQSNNFVPYSVYKIKQNKTLFIQNDKDRGSNIYCESGDLTVLEKTVNKELKQVKRWLDINKLALNVDKTNFVIFHSVRKVLPLQIVIKIGKSHIKQTKYVKFLGLLVDEHLSWKVHLSELSKKLARTCGIFFKLRHLLPLNVLVCLYYSLFSSFLQYGLIVWGLAFDSYIKPIYVLQKKVLRAISFQPSCSPSAPIFHRTNILRLYDLFDLKLASFVYESVHKISPVHFHNFFESVSSVHQHSTRQASKGDIFLPGKKSLQYDLKSVRFAGAKSWNSLPVIIRESQSIQVFKSKTKAHFFATRY